MCLEDSYLESVKKLNYIPVGLKNDNFSKEKPIVVIKSTVSPGTTNKLHKKYNYLFQLQMINLKHSPKTTRRG